MLPGRGKAWGGACLWRVEGSEKSQKARDPPSLIGGSFPELRTPITNPHWALLFTQWCPYPWFALTSDVFNVNALLSTVARLVYLFLLSYGYVLCLSVYINFHWVWTFLDRSSAVSLERVSLSSAPGAPHSPHPCPGPETNAQRGQIHLASWHQSWN